MQSDERVKSHAALTQSRMFLEILDASLLAYQDRLTAFGKMEEAGPNFFKLQGAREFIGILMTLGVPFTLPVRNLQTNLDHKI